VSDTSDSTAAAPVEIIAEASTNPKAGISPLMNPD
jgi:hypothetical protein